MSPKTREALKIFFIVLFGLLVVGVIVLAVFLARCGSSSSASSILDSHQRVGAYGSPYLDTARANMSSLQGCFAPPANYDPAQELVPPSPDFVPPYQAALSRLPAMRHMDFQQEYPGTGIGPSAREGIDATTTTTFDSTTFGPDEDYDDRVRATKGVGVSSIYSRGDNKGISMINQKSRMLDPTKMLPNVDPSRQSERMVQAGPSIEDISCRVPKAADIMKLLRASRGSALSNTIPRDRPPVYTEGLNAFRPTPLPAQTAGGAGCTIGISPYEVSDLIDYAPNPFLQSSRASSVAFNYTV